ncbi:LuxR C-terminal-related transcriptional regulator [Amycolatopsis sp. cg5]|uniref:helix-turn-helix transcriptional regulator n=1 Tax=Amycolatopsis sp. cg5 TaxID=3238802 RepID=UPI0035269220
MQVRGREEECARIEAALGSGLVVFGEPGAGKSVLLAVAARAALAAGFEVVGGRVAAHDRRREYRTFRVLLGMPEAGHDELVARLRLTRPVLVLDDVHHLDPGSAEVLAEIRPEVPAIVSTVDKGAGLELGPLPEKAVIALAEDLLGMRAGPGLRRLLKAAGGNPGLAVAMVQALRPGLTLSRGSADTATARMPDAVGDMVDQRLAPLPESTFEALRLAAILGARFTVADVAAAMDQPLINAVRALGPAMEARLVSDKDSGLSFAHGVVRQRVLGRMSTSVRRALHIHVADALDAREAPISRIAVHLAEGAEPGDFQAVKRLRAAAKRVGLYSATSAAALAARAVETAGVEYPERTELRAELTLLRLAAGDVEGARQSFPGTRGPLGEVAALHLGVAVEPGTDPWPVATAALIRAQAGEPRPVVVTGTEDAQATALVARAWAHVAAGELDEAIVAAGQATELESWCADLLAPQIPIAAAHLQADRFVAAKQALEAGIANGTGKLADHHEALAMVGFLAGEWDEISPSDAIRARVAIARNQLTEAVSLLGDGDSNLHWWSRALLFEAEGKDPARAARTAWETTPKLHSFFGNWGMAVDLARLTRDPSIVDWLTTRNAAAAAHAQGLLDQDFGLLDEAIEAYRATPRVYELARACEARQTKDSLLEAIKIYRSLGAVRDEARCTATARAAGFSVLRRRPPRPSGQGLDLLTPAETAIAQCVAEGLSNPRIAAKLYISRYTTETHLKHIFAKLGVSGRTELAAIVLSSR